MWDIFILSLLANFVCWLSTYTWFPPLMVFLFSCFSIFLVFSCSLGKHFPVVFVSPSDFDNDTTVSLSLIEFFVIILMLHLLWIKFMSFTSSINYFLSKADSDGILFHFFPYFLCSHFPFAFFCFGIFFFWYNRLRDSAAVSDKIFYCCCCFFIVFDSV